MPWVKQEDCVGCGICVEECPVGAISMDDGTAEINMNHCIRCGTCHEVCPEDAVRHDGEKIPERVEANVEWVKDLLEYYKTAEEREGLFKRMKRHFNNEKVIVEKTLEELESLEM